LHNLDPVCGELGAPGATMRNVRAPRRPLGKDKGGDGALPRTTMPDDGPLRTFADADVDTADERAGAPGLTEDVMIDSIRAFALSRDGRIRINQGKFDHYDGWKEYTVGLERMRTAGIFSPFVRDVLVPYHLDPARIPRPEDVHREFCWSGVLGLWYTNKCVPGYVQVFMHPELIAKSRLFYMKVGLLSLGHFCTTEFRLKHFGPASLKRYIFGATFRQLGTMVQEYNATTLRSTRVGDGPFRPLVLHSVATTASIMDVLHTLGYQDYDDDMPNLSAGDFLIIEDSNYHEDCKDFLVLKRHRSSLVHENVNEDTYYHIVGAIHGWCGLGIIAPLIEGMMLRNRVNTLWQGDGRACAIQCVHFMRTLVHRPEVDPSHMTTNTSIAKSLFYRAVHARDDPAMVPFMLCHGGVYDRLSRKRRREKGDPNHGYARAGVYQVASEFLTEYGWRNAPPQSLFDAKGFECMLPLRGAEINQERLRDLACVLNPREGQMADVYKLHTVPFTSGVMEPGAMITHSLVKRGGRLKNYDAFMGSSGYIEFTTPGYVKSVYRIGAYVHTVVGRDPTLQDPNQAAFLTLDKGHPAYNLDAYGPGGNDRPTPVTSAPCDHVDSQDGILEVFYNQDSDVPTTSRSRFRELTQVDLLREQMRDSKEVDAFKKVAEVLAAEAEGRAARERAQAEAEAASQAAQEAQDRLALEQDRERRRNEERDRRKAAKEKAEELKAQKVSLTDEEREGLARRAADAAKADRERLAEVEEERRARERRAREEAKRGKAKVSPQEAYKKAQEAKAIAKAQAAQSSRQASLRAADPNPARQAPAPVVAQVVQDMLEDQPRGGGKKGGRRGGRG
jgi:hypothetical protein